MNCNISIWVLFIRVIVRSTDQNGRSALRIACGVSNLSMVKQLVGKGANVNDTDTVV